MDAKLLKFDTIALHAGQRPDPATGARAVPIYQTTSYVFTGTDQAASLFNLERPGHIYSRISNPTTAVLEERIAALEGGVGAVATASGQAALHLAIATLTGAGGHIVASKSLYGGSTNLFKLTLPRFGIETTFVDPREPAAIGRLIAARGGVDACFGGIGINGHVAFNEPPEPEECATLDEFAARPTRILGLARETRTINAVTVGGDIDVVPRRCITVGMKEILAARKLRFYCNRPWQSGVVRRALHGPVTPACPASLLRLHPDAVVSVAEYVAARPAVGLR